MWIIVVVIIIILAMAYSMFSKSTDKIMNNTINNFEQDKWWTIGAIADIHNKKRDNK